MLIHRMPKPIIPISLGGFQSCENNSKRLGESRHFSSFSLASETSAPCFFSGSRAIFQLLRSSKLSQFIASPILKLAPRGVTICVLGLLGIFLTGCTQGGGPSAPVGTAGSHPSQQKILNLAIWSSYISPAIIEDFEAKTGVKVHISNYSSNEELLAKLQAGASGYDVAMPSDYMVHVMSTLGLLVPLNHSLLPHLKSLNPQFLKPSYDPENRYSLPYQWGTSGIALNRSLHPGTIRGWKELFKSDALAGRFSLLDDSREVISIALKALGYGINSTDPAALEEAKNLLLKLKVRVKSFTSEPVMPMVNSEVLAAHSFTCDALKADEKSPANIEYILPEEGGILWIDTLAIPKGAQNIAEAHEFIDFLLRAESAVRLTEFSLASTTNLTALGMLKGQIKNFDTLFPPAEKLKNFERLGDLGEHVVLWDRIWTEVKASSY